MTSPATRILAGLATVAAAAALTACSTSATEERAATSAPSTAAATPPQGGSAEQASIHNSADVMFAQMMIPHHEQAVELSAMASGRSQNADLIALAGEIAAAQQPEIDTMKKLLSSWGEPTTMDHGGMDHGGMGQGGMAMGGLAMGMVDQATMDKLGTLRGTEFDTLWLQSMIGHHEGAIAMAKPEVADGKSTELIDMARAIISGQQTEIDQMKTMLAAMGG